MFDPAVRLLTALVDVRDRDWMTHRVDAAVT
jgi:hypothetical protein